MVAAFCCNSDLPASVEEGSAPVQNWGTVGTLDAEIFTLSRWQGGKIRHSFLLFQLNLLALVLLLSLPALLCVSGKLSQSYSMWGIPVTGLCFSLHDLQPKEIHQKSHSPSNWAAIYWKGQDLSLRMTNKKISLLPSFACSLPEEGVKISGHDKIFQEDNGVWSFGPGCLL